MMWYLQTFVDSMWPGGKLADAAAQRTENVSDCLFLLSILRYIPCHKNGYFLTTAALNHVLCNMKHLKWDRNITLILVFC